MTDAARRDDDFGMGDVVEHKMNTKVFGIVIGFMGSLVGIRVSPSLNVLWFHEWELRLAENEEYEPPVGDEEPGDSNVVDFTKARELRANTPTKGVA